MHQEWKHAKIGCRLFFFSSHQISKNYNERKRRMNIRKMTEMNVCRPIDCVILFSMDFRSVFVCVRAKARVWTCTECRSDGMCTCQWLKWENPYWTACVCVFDLFSERSHFSLPHNLRLFPFVVSIDAVLPTEFIYRVKWTIPIRLGHGEHKNTLDCCMMEKKSSMQYYYRSYNANEENIIILFFQNFVSLEEMNALNYKRKNIA